MCAFTLNGELGMLVRNYLQSLFLLPQLHTTILNEIYCIYLNNFKCIKKYILKPTYLNWFMCQILRIALGISIHKFPLF